jgi:hypothetical protein
MTLDIPDQLLSLSQERAQQVALATSVAVWAERKRGFTLAPFHREWYRLAATMPRLCVVAPRDHAKSETFTINCTAHDSIYHPGTWTFIFAATGPQSAELKDRVDLAVHEAEPWMINGAWSRQRNDTVFANGSRVTATGALSAVRGAHPDVIVGDDVLEEQSTATEYQRKKTNRWWFGTVANMAHPRTMRVVRRIGRVTFPPTRIRLVGTPFHSGDLLMGMRTNPLYAFYRYQAEYDQQDLQPDSWAVEIRAG